MKPKFDKGQAVYSINGHEASYVASTSSGHVVEAMFEDEYGEAYAQVETWPEVYAKAPAAKLSEEIVDLEKEIAKRRDELALIELEASEAESKMAAISRRYTENEQLRNLDLWLTGACTHLVKVESYGFKVGTVEEILGRDGDKEVRLLSIYGGTRRHFQWRMASYSDGSGSQSPVLLAASEDEAKKMANQWFTKQVREYSRNGQEHMLYSLIRDAIKYGIPITEEQRLIAENTEKESVRKQIENARKDACRYQAGLDALLKQAKELGVEA